MEHCTDFVVEYLEGEHSYNPGQSRHRCCVELVVADAALGNLEIKYLMTRQGARVIATKSFY